MLHTSIRSLYIPTDLWNINWEFSFILNTYWLRFAYFEANYSKLRSTVTYVRHKYVIKVSLFWVFVLANFWFPPSFLRCTTTWYNFFFACICKFFFHFNTSWRQQSYSWKKNKFCVSLYVNICVSILLKHFFLHMTIF